MAPWAPVLYAADGAWWSTRGPRPDEFGGLRYCAGENVPGTIYIPVLPGHLHMRLEGQWIGSGGNSGFQAANLALRWGARAVLLTGMDCAGSHWHGPHAKYGGRDPQDSTRKQWLTAWENAAQAGLPIINCSRFSMIEGLPRKDLVDALQDLLGSAALAEAG